jgi:HPt (histidine-containing phosphotransfer) domain-containing protein
MSFEQTIDNETQETNLLAPVLGGVVKITSDAVDMKLLNAFEALQPDDGSDLVLELIDLYLEDAPRRILEMREAALAKEWVLLKRAVHNLKGSSANLGVLQVAETCKKLEGIGCEHSPKSVGELLEQMDQEFARASAALLSERQRRLQ